MSKVAWESDSGFLSILSPIFKLFRCFGLNFHEASGGHPLILSRAAYFFWLGTSLATCFYYLAVHFPSVFISSSYPHSSTSFLHFAIEFLNYWVYNLSVVIGIWWIARSSVAGPLWAAVEDLLVQVPLSAEDAAKCRKTTWQCVIGVLVVVVLNISGGMAVNIAGKASTDRIALELLKVVYCYSFASSALFVSVGRIVSVAFETITRELESECCPTIKNSQAVWKCQRRFGVACWAAEQLCDTFGFIIFATVSYTFIGFVNASYNLLRLYQRLPQAAEAGTIQELIPQTVRMTYNMTEHLFRLWMICHTADLIRSKALSLVPVLQSIRNDLYTRPQSSKDEGEEVHAFLLEVTETSPIYEVLGLFTLTKQVIVSLIGTTLTYLVVLCQFSATEGTNSKPPQAPTMYNVTG